jgi:hypothetical protein
MYSEENAVKMRSFKSFSLRLFLRRFSDGINPGNCFHENFEVIQSKSTLQTTLHYIMSKRKSSRSHLLKKR